MVTVLNVTNGSQNLSLEMTFDLEVREFYIEITDNTTLRTFSSGSYGMYGYHGYQYLIPLETI
jgi:hypothetical protein